jgi:cytidine deaminase
MTRELHELIKRKGYGSDQLLQDPKYPSRYYDIRRWTSTEAAADCHIDPDVDTLWARLSGSIPLTLTYLLDAGHTVTSQLERRGSAERRTGADRRIHDFGWPAGDRRAGTDRRFGERRTRRGGTDVVTAARLARNNARAAFSQFKVGAALETANGIILTGCNVENATYGLTICAERVAMFKAVSEGHRSFTRIAVVADTDEPAPPCGACRQILWEFGGNLEVILADLTEERGRYRLEELLPLPFDARFLNG